MQVKGVEIGHQASVPSDKPEVADQDLRAWSATSDLRGICKQRREAGRARALAGDDASSGVATAATRAVSADVTES